MKYWCIFSKNLPSYLCPEFGCSYCSEMYSCLENLAVWHISAVTEQPDKFYESYNWKSHTYSFVFQQSDPIFPSCFDFFKYDKGEN